MKYSGLAFVLEKKKKALLQNTVNVCNNDQNEQNSVAFEFLSVISIIYFIQMSASSF